LVDSDLSNTSLHYPPFSKRVCIVSPGRPELDPGLPAAQGTCVIVLLHVCVHTIFYTKTNPVCACFGFYTL